jgi:hypothetical protein
MVLQKRVVLNSMSPSIAVDESGYTLAASFLTPGIFKPSCALRHSQAHMYNDEMSQVQTPLP